MRCDSERELHVANAVFDGIRLDPETKAAAHFQHRRIFLKHVATERGESRFFKR